VRLEPQAAHHLPLGSVADQADQASGRLLVYANFEPNPSQGGGSSRPGDPAIDDRYCRRCITIAPTMARITSLTPAASATGIQDEFVLISLANVDRAAWIESQSTNLPSASDPQRLGGL
jgi:hypothetical protein